MGTGTAAVTFFRTLGGAIGAAVLGAILVEQEKTTIAHYVRLYGPTVGPMQAFTHGMDQALLFAMPVAVLAFLLVVPDAGRAAQDGDGQRRGGARPRLRCRRSSRDRASGAHRGLHRRDQPVGGGRGDLLGRRLDHHPHQRLGPALAQQDPARRRRARLPPPAPPPTRLRPRAGRRDAPPARCAAPGAAAPSRRPPVRPGGAGPHQSDRAAAARTAPRRPSWPGPGR